MAPRICLINPPTTVEGAPVYFPMALVSLGASLREAGHAVDVIDFDLDARGGEYDWRLFRDHAIHRFQETDANVYGISCICSNYPVALLLAQELKVIRPEAKIILGGPQPSAVPQETLAACPCVDVVVIGEGERTLLELVGGELPLGQIAGIAYRDNGRIVINPKRLPIEDLDTIPPPDFSLVNLEEYLVINPKLALIEAGRGCPFQCTFCSTSLMWNRRFRMKSPARILEEMRFLHKTYGLTEFSLTHDNFTTSPRHLREFCEYLKHNNLDSFKWIVSSRPDTLDAERLHAMVRAGCSGLYMGVDSGSERMQVRNKKHLDMDKFRRNLRDAADMGVHPTTSFVIGYPDELGEDLDETIHVALWARCNGAREVQIYKLIPHPGTEIYKTNRDNLALDAQSADEALMPIRDAEIDDFIVQYPELFSSFYTIPTPQHGSMNVLALAVFYDALINHMHEELDKLFELAAYSPVKLFQRWWKWHESQHPEAVVEEGFILETFGEFIVADLLPSVIGASKVSFSESESLPHL